MKNYQKLAEEFIKKADCKCVDWNKCNCSTTVRSFAQFLQSQEEKEECEGFVEKSGIPTFLKEEPKEIELLSYTLHGSSDSEFINGMAKVLDLQKDKINLLITQFNKIKR